MPNLSLKPLHYLFIVGAGLLVFYSFESINEKHQSGKNIVISTQQQQSLAKNFERTWQRPPSKLELEKLVNTLIRRELAYREASRLTLGRDDPDIRRRLQQKLETLAGDEAVKTEPTRVELQRYLEEHADSFRADPVVTFRQIYFDNKGNAIGADASARFLLGELQNQEMPEDISRLGDPSSVPAIFSEAHSVDLTALFGQEFTARLSTVSVGEWVGPLQSRLGLHLVYVDKRIGGRVPSLDEIADRVRSEWLSDKRAAAVDALYSRLAGRYRVSVE